MVHQVVLLVHHDDLSFDHVFPDQEMGIQTVPILQIVPRQLLGLLGVP